MKPRRYSVMVLIMTTVFGVTGLCAGLAGAQPAPGAKVLRPAAAGPSPEETLQRQLPPPAKPEELRAPSQAEMEQHCMKNPKCAAKLQQAKQGKRPAQPLPAATEPSPEERLQQSLPPPVQGLPHVRPRSHIPNQVERLFSWLDPFTPDQAWAQTALKLTLTPDNRYSASPNGGISLHGGYLSYGNTSYVLYNSYATGNSSTENKPFVAIRVNLPVAGLYLIDVNAAPSLTKLRHEPLGPILETWDYRAGCSASTCHYVTADYYTSGMHTWYFWVDPPIWGAHFYSATITSYP